MITIAIILFILIALVATVMFKRSTKTFIAPNDESTKDQFVDGSGWWAS